MTSRSLVGHRYGRSIGGPPWLLAVVGVVVGAAIVYAVSWAWTQRTSAHSQQVLEVQRGGNQSAQLRFCLGVSQVRSAVGRAEVALAAQNAGDLKLAIDEIKDGYAAARRADGYVSASVDGLSAPRNAVLAALDAAPGGLPAPATIRPHLDELALAANSSSAAANCRTAIPARRALS